MSESKGPGAPTKYKPEYCKQLIEHMAEGLSFESFAGVVDVCEDTLYEWLKVHPDFSESKKRGVAKCRLVWEKDGREGLYSQSETVYEEGKIVSQRSQSLNFGVYRLNMMNRFKWTDRVDVKSDDKPLQINFAYNLGPKRDVYEKADESGKVNEPAEE